jgi:hypothetical protein
MNPQPTLVYVLTGYHCKTSMDAQRRFRALYKERKSSKANIQPAYLKTTHLMKEMP